MTGNHAASHNQDKLGQPQHRKPRGRGKQQRQILGPAFAELGEAAIHAGADRVSAIAKKNLAARSLHQPGQRHVFKQVAADRRVSANRVVSLARDQEILAIRRSGR